MRHHNDAGLSRYDHHAHIDSWCPGGPRVDRNTGDSGGRDSFQTVRVHAAGRFEKRVGRRLVTHPLDRVAQRLDIEVLLDNPRYRR